MLSLAVLLVGCDRQPPQWRPRQRHPRAQMRVRGLWLATRKKGLRPVMSEMIRHGRLVARDGGEIQAAAAHGRDRATAQRLIRQRPAAADATASARNSGMTSLA